MQLALARMYQSFTFVCHSMHAVSSFFLPVLMYMSKYIRMDCLNNNWPSYSISFCPNNVLTCTKYKLRLYTGNVAIIYTCINVGLYFDALFGQI